ncbi:hypothetical protein CDD80_5162 [Ophiocordyceps camponoti-rufipedis]|uniref:Uncharacterized protein n=1 Tax=Ophiocordyceps camponoti-rufipedis TaxID=2004952 RepID=A0A2C5ZMD7_9HYPO|nr:hypothetical protein CDD80_5162 [Ophiocordyceps camponoti-rufipedis]
MVINGEGNLVGRSTPDKTTKAALQLPQFQLRHLFGRNDTCCGSPVPSAASERGNCRSNNISSSHERQWTVDTRLEDLTWNLGIGNAFHRLHHGLCTPRPGSSCTESGSSGRSQSWEHWFQRTTFFHTHAESFEVDAENTSAGWLNSFSFPQGEHVACKRMRSRLWPCLERMRRRLSPVWVDYARERVFACVYETASTPSDDLDRNSISLLASSPVTSWASQHVVKSHVTSSPVMSPAAGVFLCWIG